MRTYILFPALTVAFTSLLALAACNGGESSEGVNSSHLQPEQNKSEQKNGKTPESSPNPGDNSGNANLDSLQIEFKIKENFESSKSEIAHYLKSLSAAEIAKFLENITVTEDGCHPSVVKLWDLNDPQINQALDQYWKKTTYAVSLKPASYPKLKNDCYSVKSSFIASKPFHRVSIVNDTITEEVAKDLASMKTLRFLTLDGSSVSTEAARQLSESKTIELFSWNGDHHARMSMIDSTMSEIAKLKQLNHLSLNYSKITVGGAAEIAKLAQLKSLSLRSTEMSDESISLIIQRLTNLEAVNLFGTKLDRAIQTISNHPKLIDLNLSHVVMQKSDIAELMKMPTLTKINLDGVSGFTRLSRSMYGEDLVDEVLKNTRITHLSLSGNWLWSDEIVRLIELNRHIELDLSDNSIGSTNTDLFFASLAKNTTLEVLNLRENHFKGNGLERVLENQSIKTLYVSTSEMDAATKEKLEKARPNLRVFAY